MSSFIPYAGKNSIVEAVFGLAFAQPIISTIGENFEALKKEFAGEFPSFEKMQMFQITLQGPQIGALGTNPTSAPVAAGFNGSKFKADGTPSRVFRGMANGLSVHFLEYEHWSETAPKAMDFFSRCLPIIKLPAAENPIIGIGLRFTDRFTFDGNPTEASADRLLKKATHFVAPQVMAVGARWHSNSGWFESVNGKNEILHQLDVSGVMEQSAAVIVNHNMNCSLSEPLGSLTRSDGLPAKNTFADIFDKEHAANASMLRNLLNDEMLKAIGLG